MLALALPHARDLGIERALITCDASNIASRKIIEHSGGVVDDVRGEVVRYWVATR